MPSRQIFARAALRGEQQVRQLVGEQPVELLGHAAVAAPQTGLHVRDRDTELGRAERGGDSGVDVPDDHDEVRSLLQQNRLQALQHVRRLGRMRARAGTKVVVRLRQPELLEEDVAEADVVVLAGVHKRLRETDGCSAQAVGDRRMAPGAPRPDRGHDRRDLHKVGARASHMQHADLAFTQARPPFGRLPHASSAWSTNCRTRSPLTVTADRAGFLATTRRARSPVSLIIESRP